MSAKVVLPVPTSPERNTAASDRATMVARSSTAWIGGDEATNPRRARFNPAPSWRGCAGTRRSCGAGVASGSRGLARGRAARVARFGAGAVCLIFLTAASIVRVSRLRENGLNRQS